MRRTIIFFLFFQYLFLGNAKTWTSIGLYDTSWYDDLSTSFDIKNERELAGLAFLCNNGTSFANKTINLVSDISLLGHEWTPILVFEGIFNGNFHKIEDFQIDYYDDLFGIEKAFIIHNTGIVKNLKLHGSVLLASRGYGEISAGGLCILNEGEISDCIIDCIVSAYNKNAGPSNGYNHQSGGVCVINKGYIFNCTNLKDVSAKPSKYDYRAKSNWAGGIVGKNEGDIINCSNYGNIYTSVGFDYNEWKVGWGLPWGYSGGICGYNSGNISNCLSVADVKAEVVRLGDKDGSNSSVGGIAAHNTGVITNAYYSSAKQLVGPQIINEGFKLGKTQLNNASFDFTGLLNQNVMNLSDENVCFWIHSADKNNNIPFHLNGFAVETQVVDIMQNTATFVTTPTNISASIIVNKGFEYRKDNEPNIKKVYASDKFSATVVDLDLATTYATRAFVVVENGRVIRFNETKFDTSMMIVKTEEASDITAVSAILKGYVQYGNTAIKSQGFLWKAENEENYQVVYSEGQDFEYTLNNLSPSTTYCYQAFVLTLDGESVYGEEVFFSTRPIEVFIDEDATIDCNSIVIAGHINVSISTDVTIEYKKSTANHYERKIVRSNSDGTFECTLLELAPNTEYKCRAYTRYNNVLAYSEEETYKTLEVQIRTLNPLLDTSVTFRGEITGSLNEGLVGFEYRDTNTPDLIVSNAVYCTYIDMFFTYEINDVTNGNEYKYRAFYQNSNGNRVYGEWIHFTPINVISEINNMIETSTSIVYYDIAGKKVTNPEKGFFIVRHSNGTVYTIIK